LLSQKKSPSPTCTAGGAQQVVSAGVIIQYGVQKQVSDPELPSHSALSKGKEYNTKAGFDKAVHIQLLAVGK